MPGANGVPLQIQPRRGQGGADAQVQLAHQAPTSAERDGVHRRLLVALDQLRRNETDETPDRCRTWPGIQVGARAAEGGERARAGGPARRRLARPSSILQTHTYTTVAVPRR